MNDLDADVTVVGAGAVGLAVAVAAARAGHRVIVFDREAGPGRATSSRNSGVIHAGLHYPAASLKAEACLEGARLLYERAERLGIPHARTGKFIVAVEADEVPALEALARQATTSGIAIEILDGTNLRAREPNVRGCAALFIPSSGVIDAVAYVASLAAEAQALGVDLVLRHAFESAEATTDAWRIAVRDAGGDTVSLTTRFLVNAAGLEASDVAQRMGIDVDAAGWRLRYVKGNYCAVSPRAPLPACALVYPMPVKDGLGIHLTRSPAGEWYAGPDTEPVETIDYDVPPTKVTAFAADVRRYLPALEDSHLTPAYAGLRPKRAGSGFQDFALADGAGHGAARSIHLVGIESPGLTASLSLARRTVDLLAD